MPTSSPFWYWCVHVLTFCPFHDEPALIPNRLLPTTERPQPVLIAVCASNIRGDTPSCCPAFSSSGISFCENAAISSGEAPPEAWPGLPVLAGAAAPAPKAVASFGFICVISANVAVPGLTPPGAIAAASGRMPLPSQYGPSGNDPPEDAGLVD